MNSSEHFVSHRLNRHFSNGIPEIDFVVIIYWAITPTGLRSKYYHIFWYQYPHNKHANRVDRINECLRKSMNKRKPKLPKKYKWDKPKVMRVD